MYFLYEKKDPKLNLVIQYVLANREKRVQYWYPGNTYQEYQKYFWNQVFGYTGKMFKSLQIPQNEQEYWLFWSALDVDEKLRDIEEIKDLCPEISIRTSFSGRGFHCYLRFEKPLHFEAGESCQEIVKSINYPFKEKIESLGYKVDKMDNRVMFFSGGLNEWVHKSKIFIPVKKKVGKRIIKAIGKQESLDFEINDEIKEFLYILEINQFFLKKGKTNIYMKDFNKILNGSRFKLNTKSPMQSNTWHINGYICFDESGILVWANADNKPCLEIKNDINITY